MGPKLCSSRFILQKNIILRLLTDLEPIVLDLEPIVLDRSRVGNQLGNLSTTVTVLRPSLVCSLRHPSSDYSRSNQTLVTIVGTIVRFEVRFCCRFTLLPTGSALRTNISPSARRTLGFLLKYIMLT